MFFIDVSLKIHKILQGPSGVRMSFGYNSETLSIPGLARQYPIASRHRYDGFDRVSESYPEDILRNPV